jgi:3-oxoacyl-[acyl-carrier-protein] synthase II
VSVLPLITGIGLATPLGNTLTATWRSLLAGLAIADHARVPGVEGVHGARVDLLAQRVAMEAVRGARWTDAEIRDAALIVGTSKGPVDSWLESAPDARTPNGPFTFGLAQTATAVANALQIGGPRLTLSSACSSGLHALIRGALMIRSGEAQRVMVVTAESSLHALFIASFQRLGVIAPPGHGCRSFDTTRKGFLVAEAAAAICLEASDPASAPKSSVIIENFSLAADASHLTANDPAGKALSRLIRRTMGSSPIDLIHAHGTGTIANDADELRIIESSIDAPTNAILYSHKAALGHSLGAAGLVAIAINCQCHRTGIVPANVNTHSPLPATNVILSDTSQVRPIRQSMALAAGFGGALAAVRLKSS